MPGLPPIAPPPVDIKDSPSSLKAADNHTPITERPDGFYWQDQSTEKMYGPFTTRVEAVEDFQYRVESTYEVGETLQEAEAEIGISDWIDPDTGEPAEGSMPHLND